MSEIKEIICVELDNDFNDEYKYKAIMGFNKESYTLYCSAGKNEDYETMLSKKMQILSDADKSSREFVKKRYIRISDNIKTMDWVQSRVENLKDDIKTVNIKGKIDDIYYFVKQNSILTDKELIIGNNMPLNDEDFNKLYKYFGHDDDVLYGIKGNNSPIKIDEYRATLLYINNIVKMVERNNYSPLEKLIYAYDIIRSKEYKEVDTKEKYYYSRDLTSVCLGDYIVCVGFANILREVLNKLGIPTINIYFNSKVNKPSHVRNLVYLDDSAYHINGFYELDATFDCKNRISNYLLSYRYFLKTPQEMAYSDEKNNYVSSFKFINEEVTNDYHQFLNDNILTDQIRKLKDSLNELFMMKEKNVLSEKKSSYINLLRQYKDYLNQPVDNITFFNALYHVRSNEYYQDSNLYPYGIKEFYYIIYNSNFKMINGDCIDDLLSNNENLQKNMLGIKLTKSLKEYSLNRIDKQ